TLDKVRNFSSSFRLVPEGCSLSAIEHEEKIDSRWHCECKQKLGDGAFLIDGRVTWNVGDAPYSHCEANSRKNVRVFWKPESCARPKDEEPYGAESQKHSMQKLKSPEQLSEHSLPRNITEV